MSDRADKARKQEIERKKAQLRAIRQKKALDQQQTSKVQPPTPTPKAPEPKVDINDLVSSLLADRPVTPTQTPAVAPANGGPEASTSAPALTTAPTLQERLAGLSVVKVVDWHVPSTEAIVYNRGTQTDSQTAEQGEGKSEEVTDTKTERDGETRFVTTTDLNEAVPMPSTTAEAGIVGLTEDELDEARESPEYGDFVSRSVPLVERCLTMNARYDFMVDYARETLDDGDRVATEAALAFEVAMSDSTLVSGKRTMCTALDWSVHHPELLAAAYGTSADGVISQSGGKDGGTVLLWNLHVPQRPEMVFKAQSSVTAVQISPFQPNMIVGGTYSGETVLWDMRAKATPVQRTPLGAESHTHPVYALAFVGTQNAHNLMTTSTDGRMCSWSLDMLAKPQDSMLLQHKQTKAVSATSLSFADGDTNNFIIGSEDGAVYTGCRHGSKAGVADLFRGHHGPVTAVRYHQRVPGATNIDLSDLFLSSSTDWTVNLWSSKIKSPLITFDNASNYVYDVAWSPKHPGAFAYVSGCNLSLVDLTVELETPVTALELSTENRAAVNRLRWSTDGSKIACGDARGGVHIYNVGEMYAKPNVAERCVETAQVISDLKSHSK